jgi:HSP20 family protein
VVIAIADGDRGLHVAPLAPVLPAAAKGLNPQWVPRDAAPEPSEGHGGTLMAASDTPFWMWSEACEMLARAERLHRQSFRLRSSLRAPAWEPPADVLETAREVLVIVALPGVDTDAAEVVIEEGELVVVGVRVPPAALRDAAIHRLELPQGRFERRLELPPGRYANVRRSAVDGCLVISLEKAL